MNSGGERRGEERAREGRGGQERGAEGRWGEVRRDRILWGPGNSLSLEQALHSALLTACKDVGPLLIQGGNLCCKNNFCSFVPTCSSFEELSDSIRIFDQYISRNIIHTNAERTRKLTNSTQPVLWACWTMSPGRTASLPVPSLLFHLPSRSRLTIGGPQSGIRLARFNPHFLL